jgi:NAD-dependent deacetylase
MYVEKPPEIPPVPKCPECDSFLRPGVVWFGEQLPDVFFKALDEASRSKVMVVAGTSAIVQPAASLPLIVKRNGGKIIEVNPVPTHLSPISDVSIRGTAGKVLGLILEKIKNNQSSENRSSVNFLFFLVSFSSLPSPAGLKVERKLSSSIL